MVDEENDVPTTESPEKEERLEARRIRLYRREMKQQGKLIDVPQSVSASHKHLTTILKNRKKLDFNSSPQVQSILGKIWV